MKEGDLQVFKYFLECYFNMSVDYDELEELINNFISSEKPQLRQQLKQELVQIQKTEEWDAIKEYIRLHGMRRMDDERIRWFIQQSLSNLN